MKVEIHGQRRILDAFFQVDEAEVSFERFDGSMSPVMRRLSEGAGLDYGGRRRYLRGRRLLVVQSVADLERFQAHARRPGPDPDCLRG
jgi:hypothetical protein